MRVGSLVSTAVLAGGAALAPRLLAGSAGLDPQAVGRMIETVRAYDSGAGLDEEVGRQLRALEDGRVEEFPLDRLAALQAAGREASAGGGGGAPAVDALLEAFRKQKPLSAEWNGQVLGYGERLRRSYRDVRPRVMGWIGLALAGTFAAALLGVLPFMRGLARFALGMAFGLSGRWLMFVSLLVPTYAASAGLNVWPLLPGEVVLAPIALMLLSGGFLWLLDPNYPLWNTVFKAFGSPMLSCLGVAGWARLKPSF